MISRISNYKNAEIRAGRANNNDGSYRTIPGTAADPAPEVEEQPHQQVQHEPFVAKSGLVEESIKYPRKKSYLKVIKKGIILIFGPKSDSF